jgi:hypothetical protein
MALPVVKTAADCADFSKTVLPFFSQLTSLPSRLIDAGIELDSLKQVYLTTNPFTTAIAFSLFLIPLLLIASELNKNYSQVDRLWSILPSVYNAHFAVWARLNGLPTDTINTILTFSLIWSVSIITLTCCFILLINFAHVGHSEALSVANVPRVPGSTYF